MFSIYDILNLYAMKHKVLLYLKHTQTFPNYSILSNSLGKNIFYPMVSTVIVLLNCTVFAYETRNEKSQFFAVSLNSQNDTK